MLKNVLNATAKEKSVGNWTCLHNEELCVWYVLVNIVMKSRATGFEMEGINWRVIKKLK